MTFATIDPTTGETVQTFEELDEETLEQKLAKAQKAFADRKRTPFADRAARMRRAAELLAPERERLARVMVEEMGKPIAAARAEIDKCAWVCRHYAEHAEGYLRDEPVDVGEARAFVRHLPLGPVLAV